MNDRLQAIARQFTAEAIVAIAPLGNGLINDTFRVATDSAAFVLQRINQHVFPNPERVMANMHKLGEHIQTQDPARVKLRIPAIISTNADQNLFKDETGQSWRALQLIQPAESREQLNRQTEAEQIGFALGHFHRLCSTLPSEQLHDTLPGFHMTPAYYQSYQRLMQQALRVQADAEFHYCREFIEEFRPRIDSLEQAKHQEKLTERVIHGDPKLNNFLFVPDSDQIISLIDLDTVKPGLVHYDIGDCLRSCCHIPEDNHFNLDRCRSILTHYLREAGEFFSAADYDYLYTAILLIPFELGLRFFSDYLDGNRYFKINEPQHNLRRAVALFQLCEDIARQRIEIEAMIASIGKIPW